MFFLSGEASFGIGDLYMFIAIILCGFGYAEGGVLSKKGGWQVICWALILALPIMIMLLFFTCLYLSNSIYSAIAGWFMYRYLVCLSVSFSGTKGLHKAVLLLQLATAFTTFNGTRDCRTFIT